MKTDHWDFNTLEEHGDELVSLQVLAKMIIFVDCFDRQQSEIQADRVRYSGNHQHGGNR